MFSNLSEKLDKVFRNIRGKGYLTEQNIKDALRGLPTLIEVDGGVNAATAPGLISSGAGILVSASHIFSSHDRAAAIHSLRVS